MGKMLKVILSIILVSGLIMTGCSAGPGSEEPAQGAKVGMQAPDFQFENLEGQSTSLSNLQGKPVLINFWATWCAPCRSEMPYLQEIFEEWSDKGLVVLAINIGESPSQVKGFLQSYNLSLPVLFDTRGNVAQKYSVQWYPTTFFIDKNGIIRVKIIGPFQSKEQIEKKLGEIMP